MKIGVFEESYVITISVVQVAPDSYIVFGTHKNIPKKGNKPDADTMDGNTLLWVTQNACVARIQLLMQ